MYAEVDLKYMHCASIISTCILLGLSKIINPKYFHPQSGTVERSPARENRVTASKNSRSESTFGHAGW